MKFLQQTKQWACLGILAITLYSCSRDNDGFTGPEQPELSKPYDNGFFIIGEGSYGKSAGTVNFYAYGADTVATRVYEKENPGKITSNAAMTSTLQFAGIINGKLYLLSKINGPIVKVDAGTLKEEARYTQEASNWRSIVHVSGNTGLVSANDGVYYIDLTTLQVQSKLQTVSAVNSGDMIKTDNYIFVLQSNGVKIINVSSNNSFVKSFTNINRGLTTTPNGKVWGAVGTRLVAIDSKLDTAGVTIPVAVSSWGLDAPTILTASTKENAVFYHSGTKIYKYIDGNPGSLDQPFITINESPFMVYGAIRYDKNKDYLIVNGIKGYGNASTINYLLIYNASNGSLVKKIVYGGDETNLDFQKIYFPTLSVFH